MKERVTVTLDPQVVERAKKLAFTQKTNLSALVEKLLRTAVVPGQSESDFVTRWAGKLSLAPSEKDDMRMKRLKEKYKLSKL